MSDLERTILDGLKQPGYCGGLIEVAKGFCMKCNSIDPKKLVDYALRLKRGVVIRRLGFPMELFEIKAPKEIARLQSKLTATDASIDPDLPAEGKFITKWRLRLNVTEDELLSRVRT